MAQTSKAKKGDGHRTQGQQNAFSGIKLEFLESYKDRFIDSTDRGAFYTLVAKAFIQRFGYNLAIENNPEPDDDDDEHTPDDIDPLLPRDEQNLESDRRNGFYRELREVRNILRDCAVETYYLLL